MRWEFADESNTEDNVRKQMVNTLLVRPSGVFLWVVFVVDILLRDRDNGKSVKYLEGRLQQVPPALEDLFTQLLEGLSADELRITVMLFR